MAAEHLADHDGQRVHRARERKKSALATKAQRTMAVGFIASGFRMGIARKRLPQPERCARGPRRVRGYEAVRGGVSRARTIPGSVLRHRPEKVHPQRIGAGLDLTVVRQTPSLARNALPRMVLPAFCSNRTPGNVSHANRYGLNSDGRFRRAPTSRFHRSRHVRGNDLPRQHQDSGTEQNQFRRGRKRQRPTRGVGKKLAHQRTLASAAADHDGVGHNTLLPNTSTIWRAP